MLIISFLTSVCILLGSPQSLTSGDISSCFSVRRGSMVLTLLVHDTNNRRIPDFWWVDSNPHPQCCVILLILSKTLVQYRGTGIEFSLVLTWHYIEKYHASYHAHLFVLDYRFPLVLTKLHNTEEHLIRMILISVLPILCVLSGIPWLLTSGSGRSFLCVWRYRGANTNSPWY